MPCANCARTSAVAGATTNASIDCATAMCSIAESILAACSSPGENIPVITFSPESAANVSGRTNSWAARVMMTCTRMPRSCSKRTISAALYAAIPPVTPSAIFIPFSIANLRSTVQKLAWRSNRNGQPQIENQFSVLPQRLIQRFPGLLRSAAVVWNFPFHLAGSDFILRDTAGFAGTGIDHGRRAGLKLACAASCDQNVTVVAVEAFDQLH